MTDPAMTASPILCREPALDPMVRAMMPMGLIGLCGFMVVWLGGVLAFAWSSASLLYGGERIVAEAFAAPQQTDWNLVRGGWSARYVDAQGKPQTFALPKGIVQQAGLQFEVLRSGSDYTLPDTARSNLIIASVMSLFGLLPFFVARHAWRQLRLDRHRIDALRRANVQVPAISVRTVQVPSPRRSKNGSRPPWYRSWAEFDYQGRRYQAPGEMRATDPGTVDPIHVRVHVHPADPLQSMVLNPTLATVIRSLR